MAQFAPVAPIQVLEEMKARKCLGTYHLLLAHHVLEEPDRFKALFADTKGMTIIMDNSIVELGDSASEQHVLDACRIIQNNAFVGPNWIFPVLTDVMGDGEATREAAEESYKWWDLNAGEFKVMVVAQGKDWPDYCATVDKFLAHSEQYPNIEYVGIPRVLVKNIGSRQLAIQYADAIAPMTNVHLLGFSDDVTDDIICANIQTVEGIDSAVPLRYAYSQTEDDANEAAAYYTPTSVIPPRPADWFTNGTFRDVDFRNLANIRKWVA